MILDERAPCLSIMTRASLRHVFANSARGMADAKLDTELFVALLFAPGWIVAAHPPDELDVRSWDGWPSQTPRARLPSPVPSEEYCQL